MEQWRRMTWRISIKHHSSYKYSSPAWSSYNEIRMTPRNDAKQKVVSSQLVLEPNASALRYLDYWGTTVDAFDLHVPHTHMTIESTAIVDTAPFAGVQQTDWSVVHTPTIANDLYEYLQPTRYVTFAPAIVDAAQRLKTERLDTTLANIVEWSHARLHYEAGVTTVQTSAAEALQHGRGVCQDYAHLAIAAARCLGIPARYVSGYLHPDPDGELGEPLIGESHAWIELWNGAWTQWDPTNLSNVGERHVVVGTGRDYADVTPFKGIFHGGATQALTVEVHLTRLA